MHLNQVVNTDSHPLTSDAYRQQCLQQLKSTGVLVMQDFLMPAALDKVIAEGKAKQHLAFYTNSGHNVYLTQKNSAFADDHTHNQWVQSSKGCITDDQIGTDSALRTLYDDAQLKSFLAFVLGEHTLHPYADPLSSINLHYASQGQELGWHFDNSSFAITLLIQSPTAGGQFEYVSKLRDSSQGDMNYAGVQQVLNGDVKGQTLAVNAGDLVLFRGRDALHRVTPTEGDTTRMLVVLAYNSEPNVELSESARMTFYGRLQ
ncbi:MAG TPA: arpA protein [Oceanospirillaceae bacterium]|nr:arpA protein [Oceanospirillaceae bacterium]